MLKARSLTEIAANALDALRIEEIQLKVTLRRQAKHLPPNPRHLRPVLETTAEAEPTNVLPFARRAGGAQ